MKDIEFRIQFERVSSATANQWAADLKHTLSETHPSVQVSRLCEPGTPTMDLGAILEIALGSIAIKEVAKGLHAWLSKHQNATIQISQDGAVKATGLRAADALKLAEMVLKPKNPK